MTTIADDGPEPSRDPLLRRAHTALAVTGLGEGGEARGRTYKHFLLLPTYGGYGIALS